MTRKPLKPFSEKAQSLIPGTVYEHYSQKCYKIIGVARHSETLEELVVYQALNGDHDLWVRPVEMFLETVECLGSKRSRFELISQP